MAESLPLPDRLQALLRSAPDNGTLLRELHALAAEKGFRDLAPVWAPALYERDPHFFTSFLLRYLDGGRHAAVIRALLPRAEAAEQDSLFQGLYRKIVQPGEWNRELLALARSDSPDEQVRRAVHRRALPQLWITLEEKTALALYCRNPSLFRDFIRDHARQDWSLAGGRFRKLRDETARQGDMELHWALFRQFASEAEWQREVQRLLHEDLPPDQVVAELQRRHVNGIWTFNPTHLIDILEKYGPAVLPYLQGLLPALARRDARRMLRVAERLGDEDLYWRIFFTVSDQRQWHQSLLALLARSLDDEELQRELQRRTPPDAHFGWWQLDPEVAKALYLRNRQRFRPFLERFILEPSLELVQLATQAGDEEFLDFLTFRALGYLTQLHYRAFPQEQNVVWGARPDPSARQLWEELSQVLVGRLERLHAEAPETYVRHAANALGRIAPYTLWSVGKQLEGNPVLAYLASRHRDAWRRSPRGMRELLESPNIHVQIIGLDMLADGGDDAAQRVVENLPMLQALLLGRARKGTKRKVLACLEQAARQGPAFAEKMLPALENALDLRGRRAIPERILVSYVRLRYQQQMARPVA